MKIPEFFYVNGCLQSQDYYNFLHCFLSNSNYSYHLHIHVRTSLAPFDEYYGNHYNIYFDDEDEILCSFEDWQKHNKNLII